MYQILLLIIPCLPLLSLASALPHRAPKALRRPDLDLQDCSEINSQNAFGTLHAFSNQFACGAIPTPSSSTLIVALPPADFESGQNCFQPVTIYLQNSNAAITALMVDECSECSAGTLGMSERLFNSLGLPISDANRLEVTWSFAELPPSVDDTASGPNAGETLSNEIESRDLSDYGTV
ncbi:hypothetical protein M422DRAFT_68952 [Sphaerobolus stellatus SS14]|uniref:RlpA-like protein double-psi beta-barrel domain-containing protein n=1 Tax=Sphaerobolus stellatus (strain SS14) TaxID=990650 RepID=A0A0C9UVQ4_SPHS4|nr:hypothetical protein M422DRAFT_68952 [Sphaerobolus stellatus SS14]